MKALPALRRTIQMVLEALLVGYIVYYVWNHRGDLVHLWRVDLADAAGLLMLTLAGSLVRAWEQCYIVGALDARLTFRESFHLTMGCTLLNYLPLNAGTVIKARFLKANQALKYAHFVSMMSALVLVTLMGGGLLGLAVLPLSADFGGASARWTMAAVLAAAVLAPLGMLNVPPRWLGSGKRFIQVALRDMLEGWGQLRRRRGGLCMLSGLSILKLLLMGGRFWICFRAFGADASFVASVLFAIIANLMMLVNITPGSLGVREVLIAAVAAWTGMAFDKGVFAAGLDRMFSLAFAVLSGVPSLIVMRRSMRR